MPYVPKYKPDELKAVAQSMIDYPADQVERDYRLGKISLNDKLFMLQTYGIAQREIAIMGTTAEKAAKETAVTAQGGGATGEVKYYAQNIMKEYKASWDAAVDDHSASKAIFHGLMGSLNVLKGYDLPGDILERWSLEMFPESPGFARAVNWAAWGYTNFVGISSLLKPIFKAAQGGAKAVGKTTAAVADYSSFLKDPVNYVVKESRAVDAAMATKVAATKSGAGAAQAGVSGAAIQAEKAGGKQAFQTAKPTDLVGPVGGIEPTITSPQQLEAMTTNELIKFYEQRSREMIRSSTEPFKYGGVSHEATQAAASVKPVSFEDILSRGPDAPISATELEAIGRVHKEVLDNFNAVVDDARKVIPDIQAGMRPDLVQSYKAHLAAAEVTNPAFLSARGQAGRGLEYLKTMPELIQNSLLFDTINRGLSAEKYLNGSNDVIAYSIKKLGELTDKSRYSLLNMASTEGEKSAGRMRLFYKTLLFSRPGIHVGNILGNLESSMLYGVNKTASAAVPFSDVSWREAMAYWSGMWDSRKTFVDLYAKAAERGSKNLAKAGIEGTATGAMVHYGPLGWLGFEDEFGEGIVRHGLAKSQAVKEGLSQWDELKAMATAGLPSKKQFIADFVDRSMNDPKNYERLVETINPAADYIVFHSPLSRGGESFAKWIRETPFDYIMPVVMFPLAAMKMSRDWTPGLQFLSRDAMRAIAEGGEAEAAFRARVTLSWMVSSQVYEAAKAGKITGGGPMKQDANAVWRAAGNVPYAINGVPIKWVAPLGDWFGMIADTAQAANEMKPEDVNDLFSAAVQVGKNALVVGGRAIESNYWLRIMQSITGAVAEAIHPSDVNDTLGAIGKAVLQPIKTVLGGGTLGRTVGEGINPEQSDLRFYGELNDLKNWMFAGSPLWGHDTRPRINFSGNVAVTPPVLGSEWVARNLNIPEPWARGVMTGFMPPVREGIQGDDVAKFLYKHGLTLHSNFKYYGGTYNIEAELPPQGGAPRVSLSGDQAYNWEWITKNDAKQYGTGRTWRESITALEQDQNFQNKDHNQKQQEVNRLFATYRRTGLDMLRKIDPEVKAKEVERDNLANEQRNRPSMSIELQPGDEGAQQQAEPSPIPQVVPSQSPDSGQPPPPAE